jgi:Cu-Zn family superoxide dismutase
MTRICSVLLASCLVVAACGRDEAAESFTDERDMSGDVVGTTSAAPAVHLALAPTAGHTAAGMLMLSDTDDGVAIEGRITGLEPDSRLGFHVHEVGDCSAPDASSAGEHFNPTKQPHGDPDDDERHLGDLPNLDVNDDGEATVDVTLDGVSLDRADRPSIRNRAIVVHAEEDDYETQPSGASGARVACGVIGGTDLRDNLENLQRPDPGVVQTPGLGEAPEAPRP